MKISSRRNAVRLAVLALAIAAAIVMARIDSDGTFSYLKAFLYLTFFLSLFIPGFFYPQVNCTAWLSRLAKRKQ